MSIQPKLSEHEVSTITNALGIAAERFDDYAATIANHRVAEQFAQQAKDSRALIEKLDEAEDA